MKLVFFDHDHWKDRQPLEIWQNVDAVPIKDDYITLKNGTFGWVMNGTNWQYNGEVHINLHVVRKEGYKCSQWEELADGGFKDMNKKDTNGIFNYKLPAVIKDSPSVRSP